MENVLQAIDENSQKPARSQLSKTENNCNKLLFSDLCLKFEEIEKTSGADKKFKIIFNKSLTSFLAGQSVFPLMRLVLPLIDSERGKYGLKQAAVAKTYVDALHLDKKISEDAQRLIYWKDPTKAHGADVSKMVIGDFCTILEDVLKTRVRSEDSHMNLGQVNAVLDELAGNYGKDKDSKTAVIRDKIINNFSAMEQKWLMRIVFQDLKIGLKHEQVLNRFSPTALQRYNECTNLRTVCEEEGAGVEMAGIQIFTPFAPMLAKGFPRSNFGQVAAVEAAMKGQPFVMDVKLDGERMMAHIKNGEIMLFSRNGTDYSDSYCMIAQDILRSVSCSECIIDGEICAWDNASKSYMPFGHNAEAGREEREAAEYVKSIGSSSAAQRTAAKSWEGLSKWLVYIIFDVVFVEGMAENVVRQACDKFGYKATAEGDESGIIECGEITHFPLAVRRDILRGIISLTNNRIEFVNHKVVSSPDVTKRKESLEEFFNEVTLAGEEGLVVKNLASTYELGVKSKALELWVKMKPEYGDQTEDLDLLILGAYYGEGKSLRGRGLSTFLLGIRDDQSTLQNPRYLTLCKVGTGYSFDQLQELRNKLNEVAIPWDPKSPPPHLAHWRIGKQPDRPNVFIPPDQSFVVELKCAEIVESTQFSAGITCRFPRLQRIRYDKPVSDVMTLSEVQEVRNRPRHSTQQALERSGGVSKKGGKKRKVEEPDDFSQPASVSRTLRSTVDSKFRVNTKDVVRTGKLFEGMVFCVIDSCFEVSPNKSFTREDIIKTIQSHGGVVVASPRPQVHIIVGSKRTFQVATLVKSGIYDVVDFSYVIDCVEQNIRLPMKSVYFHSTCPQTQERLRGQADPFGDSFTDEVTPGELLQIVRSMNTSLKRMEDQILDATGKKRQSARARTAVATVGGGRILDGDKLLEQNDFEPISLPSSDPLFSSLLAVRDARKLQFHGWREIAASFEEDELDVVRQNMCSLWTRDVVVFLDVVDDLGDLQAMSSISSDRLWKSLRSKTSCSHLYSLGLRLQLRGCVVSPNLHVGVTHVVLSPSNYVERAEAVRGRLRSLRMQPGHLFEKRVVFPSWAEKCIAERALLEPTEDMWVKFPTKALLH